MTSVQHSAGDAMSLGPHWIPQVGGVPSLGPPHLSCLPPRLRRIPGPESRPPWHPWTTAASCRGAWTRSGLDATWASGRQGRLPGTAQPRRLQVMGTSHGKPWKTRKKTWNDLYVLLLCGKLSSKSDLNDDLKILFIDVSWH